MPLASCMIFLSFFPTIPSHLPQLHIVLSVHTSAQHVDTVGFEFVLDTAVARNTVFNYRLNLGYEKFESKDADLDMESIIVDNTFGFAAFRNKVVRLWLGPQVRFSYTHDEQDDFVSVRYPLSKEMIADKDNVTVTFKPQPNNNTGRIFDLRIVEAE